MEKIISHPVIGDITIKKRVGNKNIRITVHPTNGVNVSIPWFVRFSTAEKFLSEREDWIISSIDKQKEKRKKREVVLGEGHPFWTLKRVVEFAEKPVNADGKIKIVVSSNSGRIEYPCGTSRENLAKAITKILRYDAKVYLPARAKEMADKYGFSYNKVFLKDNKTNWGSCSRLNNINLNIHLMRLPQELSDYVILHELCHLKHHNHGEGFHKLLDKLCDGKEKVYSRQLRTLRTNI